MVPNKPHSSCSEYEKGHEEKTSGGSMNGLTGATKGAGVGLVSPLGVTWKFSSVPSMGGSGPPVAQQPVLAASQSSTNLAKCATANATTPPITPGHTTRNGISRPLIHYQLSSST